MGVVNAGITEITASLPDSLRRIGRGDGGQTVVIGFVKRTPLGYLPIVLRFVGLALVLSLIVFRQPFAGLDAGPLTPALQSVRVGVPQWVAAVAIYLVYLAVSFAKNGRYVGQPGAELHFTRFQKIVRTLKPGERLFVFDPRVQPYAVVSTKPVVVTMEPVEGNARDNIALTYRGALILRVTDTFRLLEQGGFKTFLQQLGEVYESVVKDAMLTVPAREFGTFLVEPVRIPAGGGESLTDRLGQLQGSDLTVELLTNISEIDELDISTFGLEEPGEPRRRALIGRLQSLAQGYGIEILDHLPQGSLTSEAYLRTLSLSLVSSITRLRQATETLKEITEEELSEEVAAKVADLQLGVLGIERVIREVEAITHTLQDAANKDAIVHARKAAIVNTGDGILREALSLTEGLLARLRAEGVATAGLDAYLRERDDILRGLEAGSARLPKLRRFVTDQPGTAQFLPDADLLERLLSESGTAAALAKLRGTVQEGGTDALEARVAEFERQLAGLDAEAIMTRLTGALGAIPSGSGISTEAYSVDRIRAHVDDITRRAEAEVGVLTPGEPELEPKLEVEGA